MHAILYTILWIKGILLELNLVDEGYFVKRTNYDGWLIHGNIWYNDSSDVS